MQNYEQKMMRAAEALRSICPLGNPSENQIVSATQKAGLPVKFPVKSFILDPVRMAVFVLAYKTPLKDGVTMEQVIETSRQWAQSKS